jgi:hypothetical protein
MNDDLTRKLRSLHESRALDVIDYVETEDHCPLCPGV